MTTKVVKLSAAMDYFMFQTDVHANIISAFTYCESNDNVYVSPKTLLLMSVISQRFKSREQSITAIMHACDISKETEISKYTYNTLWGNTDISKRTFSEQTTTFNPYELELLDLVYFGDFIISSKEFMHLISKYELGKSSDEATVAIYEDLCEKLFSQHYKKWELIAYSPMTRIPIVIELAKRYLQYNPSIDFNFVLSYVEENANYVAQDLELLYDSDD